MLILIALFETVALKLWLIYFGSFFFFIYYLFYLFLFIFILFM